MACNVYHVAHCPNGCEVGGDWDHYEPCQECGAELTLVQIMDEPIKPEGAEAKEWSAWGRSVASAFEQERSDTSLVEVLGGIVLAAAALVALACFFVGAYYILRGLW